MKLFIGLLTALMLTNLHARQFSVDYHIKFWTPQLLEHVKFAHGFTTDPVLKQEGSQLMQEWNNFKDNMSYSKQNVKNFLTLSDKNLAYQSKVASDVKNSDKKKEEKNLHKDLLDHMDKETKYAKRKARGEKLSKEEDAKFWSEEHEGEAKVIAVLMKPDAPALKAEAQEIEKDLKNNHGIMTQSSVAVIKKDNARLDELAKKVNPSNNKIPKDLADHEARERKYAAEILN